MPGRPLVIVGAGEFGDMALEYFADDSEYEVVGFAVEAAYRTEDEHLGLPLVDVEHMAEAFDPRGCDAFVAVTHVRLNRERERLAKSCGHMGYRLASYVSSHAFVGRGAEVGPGAFVMEGCSVQRGARIGEGSVLWCNCAVAHSTAVGRYCWLAPGVSMGGFSAVGDRSFVGVGAAIGDNVEIACDVVVGAGSVATHDLATPRMLYTGSPASARSTEAFERFTKFE